MHLRTILLRLHRWSGLTLGVVLAAIALSGAATVAVFDVERWVGLREAPADSGRAPFEADAVAIATAFPGAQCDNYFPADAPGRPDRIETVLRSGERKEDFTVFCDPASGRVIGDTRGSTLVAFLHAVGKAHGSLFLSEAEGRTILGFFALALLAFAASGLWLWWTMAAAARSSGGTPFAWHRALGFLTLPVLLISAGTGLLFSWQWTRPLTYRALGGDAATLPYFAMTDTQRAAFRGTGVGTPLGIDALVAAARAQPAVAGCDRVLRITSLASKAAKPVKIAFDYPGNDDYRAGGVVVQIDRISGAAVFVDDPRGRLSGWLLSRQWAFHAGRWGSSADGWGIAARWLWIVGGVGIAALALSGAVLWRRRRRQLGG